jgi:hypothetical protein
MSLPMPSVLKTRRMYEGVSKSFRTESITKYMLTTINTRQEATQMVMAAKLTRLTHKLVIQLHLVAESLPFAVLAPGGQCGNFWIHPRTSHIGKATLSRKRMGELKLSSTLNLRTRYR